MDGFNAPVTAGNFVDLVQRGFYNGMEIQRSDGFVVQTGDPGPPVRAHAAHMRSRAEWLKEHVLQHANGMPGPHTPGHHSIAGPPCSSPPAHEKKGWVVESWRLCFLCQCCSSIQRRQRANQSSRLWVFGAQRQHLSLAACAGVLQDNGFREGDHVRRIPFEVMVKGDAAPFYEETLEDAGRFNDQPVLPFNACAQMPSFPLSSPLAPSKSSRSTARAALNACAHACRPSRVPPRCC